MRLDLDVQEENLKEKRKAKRNLRIALAVAALILLPTIGSTLAATVTIGGNNALEFAQGITATTACDSTIKLQPVSSLNASGIFIISSIELSTLNNASNGGCAGKFLTLKVLNSSDTLVNISTGGTTTQVKFQMPETCAVAAITPVATTDATVATISCNADTGSVTVTLVTSVLATSLNKITLESASS